MSLYCEPYMSLLFGPGTSIRGDAFGVIGVGVLICGLCWTFFPLISYFSRWSLIYFPPFLFSLCEIDFGINLKRGYVRDWILLYVTPWGPTFLMALIISGVTFDGHFPLAFTSPSVLHPYVCVARTYIPGHMHLGVTQEVSLTLWGESNPYTGMGTSWGKNFTPVPIPMAPISIYPCGNLFLCPSLLEKH